MAIPNEIPANARVVVRVSEGVDPTDHRMKYRDYVGHVTSWDGHTLDMIRDAAANGSRPEHRVTIDADTIITLKPVPSLCPRCCRRQRSNLCLRSNVRYR